MSGDDQGPAGPAGEAMPPTGRVPERGSDPLAVAGLVFAVLVPLAGLLISLVALGRTGRGGRPGRGLAVAGTVIGSLLTVLGVLLLVLVGVGLARATQGFPGLDTDVPAAERPGAAEVSDAVEAAEAELAERAARERLPELVVGIGERVPIGDYSVAVTAVTPDGADRVVAGDGSGEPGGDGSGEPGGDGSDDLMGDGLGESAEGRYVLADVSVTYEGPAQGTPWLDLDASYIGGDGSLYPRDACTAELPGDPFDAPGLAPGDGAEITYCFVVPPDAADGGVVVVGPSFDPLQEEQVGWRTG